MARIPIQHLLLSVGKSFVIFIFFYLIHCVYCLLVISFLLTLCLFTILEIFMPVSSIGYYHVFALNLRDSRIFILDPTTIAIIEKEDWMKRFSCTETD
jgi:hypothetical protein